MVTKNDAMNSRVPSFRVGTIVLSLRQIPRSGSRGCMDDVCSSLLEAVQVLGAATGTGPPP